MFFGFAYGYAEMTEYLARITAFFFKIYFFCIIGAELVLHDVHNVIN